MSVLMSIAAGSVVPAVEQRAPQRRVRNAIEGRASVAALVTVPTRALRSGSRHRGQVVPGTWKPPVGQTVVV
ncbi:hypothetical protein ACFPM0_11635 [Pseudonocardia sulfidoxydans]|uniref:hypothetical protein n=1 Tax=Pseudonocardia sulfidoxydans TaxID=54011 RepID=UPI0036178DE2